MTRQPSAPVESKDPTSLPLAAATRATNLLLQIFLTATKHKVGRVDLEPLEPGQGARISFFHMATAAGENAKPIKTETLPEELAQPLFEQLTERARSWPALSGEGPHPAPGAKSIVLSPLSGVRVQAQVTIVRKPRSSASRIRLEHFVSQDVAPLIEMLELSSAHRAFVEAGVTHEHGLLLADSNGDDIDAAAILLALRPDAIHVRGFHQRGRIEAAIAAAERQLIVISDTAEEPADLVFRFLRPLPAPVQARAKALLALSYVHRRVKRTCPSCAKPSRIAPENLNRIPQSLRSMLGETYFFGRGCAACGYSTYQGTVGIDSVLPIGPEQRSMLEGDENAGALIGLADTLGTRALLEDGLAKLVKGLTSFEELFKAATSIPPAYLPVVKARLEGTASAPQANAMPAGGAPTLTASERRMLIVEDDNDQREVLKLVFESEGYRVFLAGDGAEALQIVAKEPLDIVVCDVMMPGMNGSEFVRALRKTHALGTLPVLMLTAASDPSKEYDLLDIGADDYVRKEVQRKILSKRVERLLRKRPDDASRQSNPLEHMLKD